VNAGIVAGSRKTLIADTSANAFGAATILGYAKLAGSDNEILALNLEKHFDHIGGNSYLRAQGIDVYGHPEVKRTPAAFVAEIAEFNAAIPSQVRRDRQEANVFFSGTTLTNPNKNIPAETSLDLGDCPIDILFTPGHTTANISLFVPEDSVLICGDCLVNGYLPNLDAGTVDDWRTWQKSLERLAQLKPGIVLPGHGHVAKGDDVQKLFASVWLVLDRAIEEGRSPTLPRE
jgi:Zn-dependent hydrolases, including glyoxylases